MTSVIDHIMEHDLDIVCFCETWPHGDESDRIIIKGLSLDGYQFHHVLRKDGRGGGVAVLVKSSIQLQPQESLNYTHMEGMEVLADIGSSKLRIAILYRPPPSPANVLTLARFLDNFNGYMEGYISNPGNDGRFQLPHR